MEKVTITKVSATDKKKDGTMMGKTRNGHQTYKVGIQTNEYGDTWINGILPFNPDKWEGSTQELDIKDEEYNGKMYKKFELPRKESAPREQSGFSEVQYNTLNTKLDQIWGKLLEIEEEIKSPQPPF